MTEPAIVRFQVPGVVKERLDAVCHRLNRLDGTHYGETAAACLMLGIATFERRAIPADILAAVRRRP